MWSSRHGIEVGIAVTAGALTAITRRAGGGEPDAVLVDGWPTQTIDPRDDDQITAAIRKVHRAVYSDVDSVVVTYPIAFSLARIHRLRRTATEAGWPDVRMAAIPVAVGITHANTYNGHTAAVLDISAPRYEAAVLEPQPHADWGHVAANITAQEAQPTLEVVAVAAKAADIPVTDLTHVLVIGEPSATRQAASRLTTAGIAGAVAVSPVELAGDGLVADEVITGGNPSRDTPVRRGWVWPRPLSSLACAAAAVA
ncbi:MAG: hypothetical protein ACRD0P_23745, partial [Stackebrandtia sp.]